MDSRINAIRKHPQLGRGSCSSIDECWDDEELVNALNAEGIKSPKQAVKWAMRLEGLRVEAAANARWGEDSDPQFAAAVEWEEKMDRLELVG
jgi:hypothetical protein